MSEWHGRIVFPTKTRKLKIDFGLVLEFNVPEDVSDEEACGAIFAAASGKGDPRDGINLKADVAYHVGCQLSANLKETGFHIDATGGSTIHLSVKEASEDE